MDTIYNPKTLEQHWYQIWEKAEYFVPQGKGAPYCIMIPPPNVTGSLHMGHGFQLSLMDVLIRYNRMCGKNTLWQVGTDHAGIATQMMVERMLAKQNKDRHSLGRDKFLDEVWQWKHQSGNQITSQMRRLGISVDWKRERFTMDAGLSDAVKEVFIRLYDEGLIYRGKRLVNWDPTLNTAVSDLEVNSIEEKGSLWHIRYPLANKPGFIVVATTRPETMLGDTGVAVHPEDARYQHLIGETIKLPLTNRLIPIVADDQIDPEFGTGCVKITPAHDFNDYALGQRHRLEQINIFTSTAHLNDAVPENYRGLERFVARKKILEDLTQLNLIEKIEDHILKVPRGDRSGSVIEPYLTDQWFVKAAPLAKPAIEAVRNGDIKFIPENWDKTYFQWMENIEDWCISRQLWWGHRIPAWYDQEGNIYVGNDEASVRKKYKLAENKELHQDEDVLDTWFSSALWPFSTLGWPENNSDLETFYPTSVLVTGFDIIFFWVARMIMMGIKFTGKVPFKEVYITGLIRDSEGQKMSKTKGNVLDPIDLIDGIELDRLIVKRTESLLQPKLEEKIIQATRKEFPEGIPMFGTDALRFTYCALASTGRDIRFDVGRIEGYRNFCNKLWNAARFVLMNTEGKAIATGLKKSSANPADSWILSILQNTISKAHQYLQQYRFDLLTQTIYEFIWNEYCDWYLELSKTTLYSENIREEEKAETRYTLLYVLENILCILHPIMPFITEEIWQRVAPLISKKSNTIMTEPFPQVDTTLVSPEIEQQISWLKTLVISIRTIRAEMNINPGKLISCYIKGSSQTQQKQLEKLQPYLKNLAKIENISFIDTEAKTPQAATAVVGDLEILIPLAGLIDKNAELLRLKKEIEKIENEISRITGKLANPKFVDNAPKEVVAKERERLDELNEILKKFFQQREKILLL